MHEAARYAGVLEDAAVLFRAEPVAAVDEEALQVRSGYTSGQYGEAFFGNTAVGNKRARERRFVGVNALTVKRSAAA